MSNKVVVVLGAGFSMAIKAPSQRQLLPEMIRLNPNELESKQQSAFTKNLALVKRLIEDEMLLDTAQNLEAIDLEDVYTPIDRCIADNRAFRSMPLSEVIACRRALDTVFSIYINKRLESITTENTFVADLCNRVVSIKQQDTRDDSITFVTTNWDIILDNALYRAIDQKKGTIDYCCHTTPYYQQPGNMPALLALGLGYFSIKLLKMHGSLNWLFCPRCERLYTTFNEKISHLEYVSKPTCRICNKRYGNRTSADKGPPLVGQLLMPTYIKDLANVQIKLIWQNAGIEFSEAARIVFVGYSFPIADFELRGLLARSVPHSTEIHVVTHSEDELELERRYRSFFGRRKVMFYRDGAENSMISAIWET